MVIICLSLIPYISKEEKDKYINEILSCTRLELIESEKIADKSILLEIENTTKYKLMMEDYKKRDIKVKVK